MIDMKGLTVQKPRYLRTKTSSSPYKNLLTFYFNSVQEPSYLICLPYKNLVNSVHINLFVRFRDKMWIIYPCEHPLINFPCSIPSG